MWEAYLSRSKTAPLRIHLYLGTLGPCEEELRWLLRLIQSHTARIESYDITSDGEQFNDIVFPLSGPHPSLKSISIHLEDACYGTPGSLPLFKEDVQSTRLETLIVNSQVPWELGLGSATTQHLWYCYISSDEDSVQRMFDLAMTCRQTLEHLTLLPFLDPDENLYAVMKTGNAPFSFPKVTSLYLADSIPLSFHNLMTFPEVSHLDLCWGNVEYPWTGGQPPSKSIPFPTWPKLQVLSLEGYLLPESDDLRPILVANPSITELTIIDCMDIAGLFLLLDPLIHVEQSTNASPTILPNLSLLHFIYGSPNEFRSFGMALKTLLIARPALRVITDESSWNASIIPWEALKSDENQSMAERLSVS